MKIPFISRLPHLVPGYRFDGRYELLYPYAQGGMAVVWVARIQGKHGFEKLCAVKTILPDGASDEGFRKMFLDEARIAAGIHHPNVAEVMDLGEDRGTLYMVLEWVDGDSWSKLYNAATKAGQPFPLHLMLRIAADAAAGLHAAHELRAPDGTFQNVVHRDVSPQNVLVATNGMTKVIDFGIAKALDRVSEETRTGMLKGKVEYAAPEQVRSKNVDRRADVWALGTILYQQLSGRLPFLGKSDVDTLRMLMSGQRPPPLPPSVPPNVAAIVTRALEPAIEARFATAADMQRALEAAIPQPTNATDVAAFVQHHLADRVEMRRRDIAESLAEAAERARKEGRAGSSPDLGRARRAGSSPDLGVQASGQAAPWAGASAPAAVSQLTGAARAPADAAPLAPAPPMQAAHWVLMSLAVLVTLSVWGMVGVVLFGGGAAPAPPGKGEAGAQTAAPSVRR